jgi:hypothetical protein
MRSRAKSKARLFLFPGHGPGPGAERCDVPSCAPTRQENLMTTLRNNATKAEARECAALRVNGTRVQGGPCQGAHQGAHLWGGEHLGKIPRIVPRCSWCSRCSSRFEHLGKSTPPRSGRPWTGAEQRDRSRRQRLHDFTPHRHPGAARLSSPKSGRALPGCSSRFEHLGKSGFVR